MSAIPPSVKHGSEVTIRGAFEFRRAASWTEPCCISQNENRRRVKATGDTGCHCSESESRRTSPSEEGK